MMKLLGPQAIHNERIFKVSKNAFVSPNYDLEKRKYVKDAFHTAPTDRNCERILNFQSIKELIVRNVFFVNSTLGLGGGVRVIFNWANWLVENDHRVTLISNSREPILYKLSKKVGVIHLDIEKNGRNFLLLSLYKFYKSF